MEDRKRHEVTLTGISDEQLYRITPSYVKNDMEFRNCVVFVRERNEDISTHREFTDTDWHFYAVGNIGDSKKTDATRADDVTDLKEYCVEVSDNTLPNSAFQTGYTYDEDVVQNGVTIHKKGDYRYPISQEEWSGIKGYVAVTDPLYLNKYNLPIFYELQDGSYVKTTDTEIDTTKTYYEAEYRSPAYKSLYVDEYTYQDGDDEETQVSGWGMSFEYRYDMGGETKDGMTTASSAEQKTQRKKNTEIFRDFYTFIVTSSDEDFHAHLSDWVNLDSFLYFYLYTLRYTQTDNRAKNTFYHYTKWPDGKYRFEQWAYDMDTAEGINNSGEAVFPYGLEDTDTSYEMPDGTIVNTRPFNAAQSVLWCRIRDLFGSELRSMYNQVASCWSADALINEYDAWQNQFPEELWKTDIERKYIRPINGTIRSNVNGNITYFDDHTPTTTYVGMLNGRKKYQRRQFERDQEAYMASKFEALTNTSDMMWFRCAMPPKNAVVPASYTVHVTPYSSMYINVDFGNASIVQYKAKAGETVDIAPSNVSIDSANELQITFYGASRIQSLGDLSPLYIHTNMFSSGKHLTDLVLGNHTEGYSNTNLTSLDLGSLELMNSLDLTNCSNLAISLDLSGFHNLKYLYAKGTKISGITFATNGLIQDVEAPATVNTLIMKDLHYLTDSGLQLESEDALTNLIISNCDDLDNQKLIESASNLKQIRAVGVNFNITNEDLIEKIYAMSGYDENNGYTANSYLAGRVTIETLHQKLKEKYDARWGSNITWVYTNFVTQYNLIFKNQKDASGNYPTLETIAVDSGYTITTRDGSNFTGTKSGSDNLTFTIDPPTMDATRESTYRFVGWSRKADAEFNDSSINVIGAVTNNITLFAIYEVSPRKYSVTYLDGDGTTVLQQTAECPYGSYVPYLAAGTTTYAELMTKTYLEPQPKVTGAALTPIDYVEYYKKLIPTYVSGESGQSYALFKGWNLSGFVDGYTDATKQAVGDKTITAQYDRMTYSEGAFTGKSITDMTPLQIYTYARANRSKVLNTTDQVIQEGDGFNITLGYDVDYPDIESHTFINEDFELTGSNYYDTAEHEEDKKYSTLFDSDKAWVLEVEYTLASNSSGCVLAARDGFGTVGLDIQSNGVVRYNGALSASQGTAGTRNLIVVEHKKGENAVTIYNVNKSALDVAETPLNGSTTTNLTNEYPLVFGAYKNPTSGVYANNATGTIHKAKIWMTDLGELECKKLASWTHESMLFQVAKYGNKAYVDDTATPQTFTFLSRNLLGRKTTYGTYVTFDKSNVNDFLNHRFFTALPTQWQSIMNKSHIRLWNGMVQNGTDYSGAPKYEPSTTMTEYDTYLFVPAAYELTTGISTGNGSNYYPEEISSDVASQYPISLITDSNSLAATDPTTGRNGMYWTRSLSRINGCIFYVDVNPQTGTSTVQNYSGPGENNKDLRIMFSA